MNWRYFAGINAVLSAQIVPLTRYVPAGHFWLYDVQGFARTRDLGGLSVEAGLCLADMSHHGLAHCLQ
jgi:hypothetical protein